MIKSELRKIYKNQRNLLSTLEIQDFSQKILENLKKMPIWNKSYYHVFVPIKSQNEINTHLIIDYLFDLNKSVVVPKVNGSQMINCKIDENVEWTIGRFDVPEPKQFEIIENDLSPFERPVLELSLTGMNYQDIARLLGKDPKSTDNALNRVKTKIKKQLKNPE